MSAQFSERRHMQLPRRVADRLAREQREVKLARAIEEWRESDPHAMATGQSVAAIQFAFADAKHDILALHEANVVLRGARQTAGGAPC